MELIFFLKYFLVILFRFEDVGGGMIIGKGEVNYRG